MGCGLAENSGKGTKSLLRLPHLFNIGLEAFSLVFCSWAVPGYGGQKKDNVYTTKGCPTCAWLTLADRVQKLLLNTSMRNVSQRKARP